MHKSGSVSSYRVYGINNYWIVTLRTAFLYVAEGQSRHGFVKLYTEFAAS